MEGLRQRNIGGKRKIEFEKYKAFHAYVFTQDLEMAHSFEHGQTDERQNEDKTRSYYRKESAAVLVMHL